MTGPLFGIGEAASRAGVSERALRYYQQIGLITPSASTPGGMRRYCAEDVDRVGRIRELQDLMGFNLDEIRTVLQAEDRIAGLRAEFRSEHTGVERRRELLAEALDVYSGLLEAVEGKLGRLRGFRDDLVARRDRARELLAEESAVTG
ncbi:MAG TPA: MerR family transcriptional regulator [Acidimicrobiales bacterium]|nr:MerR family transcriptional regulator [Acidimicrobiales bacterium]